MFAYFTVLKTFLVHVDESLSTKENILHDLQLNITSIYKDYFKLLTNCVQRNIVWIYFKYFLMIVANLRITNVSKFLNNVQEGKIYFIHIWTLIETLNFLRQLRIFRSLSK